jgi:hypothetical protein
MDYGEWKVVPGMQSASGTTLVLEWMEYGWFECNVQVNAVGQEQSV